MALDLPRMAEPGGMNCGGNSIRMDMHGRGRTGSAGLALEYLAIKFADVYAGLCGMFSTSLDARMR